MPESSLPLSWLKRGLIASACAFACLVPATAAQAAPVATTEVYRLYNTTTGDRLLTVESEEYESLRNGKSGWLGEGVAWIGPENSSKPIYRFFNTTTGYHIYTADEGEAQVLRDAPEWLSEKSGMYSAETVTNRPVYRLFDQYGTGEHLLTADEDERAHLVGESWHQDDVSVYALALPGEPVQPEEPTVSDDSDDADDPLAEQRAAVVAYAKEFVGWPYVYAGESPEEGGFDCSGLVQYVYKHFGVDLPRTTYDLEGYLKERGTWTTDIEQMKLGDVIVMNGSGHVGIFAGKDPETGRYMMVDAGNPSTGVVYREIMYYYHPEWSGPLQGGGSVL